MSRGSLFYHVHEAHRRPDGQSDDFSDWLEREGVDAAVVARLRGIDFHFLNLNQLRRELIAALGEAGLRPATGEGLRT